MAKDTYKTPDEVRAQAKQRRDAIKLAGGPEYEALLAKERAVRKKFKARRRALGLKIYNKPYRTPWKSFVVSNARRRARRAGLEATITVTDIFWPTHCPVLGIELHYPARNGESDDPKRPDRASLDRWDNTKGYVPGNVFVISCRANILKSNATHEELKRIAAYAEFGVAPGARCVVADQLGS